MAPRPKNKKASPHNILTHDHQRSVSCCWWYQLASQNRSSLVWSQNQLNNS